jgi:hypothetical protein
VVVYWKYEATTCGARNAPLGNAVTQNGSRLLATYAPSDVTLLELNARPPASANAYYAGWDSTGNQPGGGVVIHHPRGHVKSISFDNDDLGTSDNVVNPPGTNTHWRVHRYEDGTTEGGSSGSCIFHPSSKRCVGFLTGGRALCSVPDGFDIYG